MEIYQYIRPVLKRWWLILLLVIAATGTSIYYVRQKPPIYQSSITLSLSSDQNILISNSVSEQTNQLVASYVRYLRTTAFAELVIQREGLNISAGELVSSISANVVPGTSFFKITATGNDPQRVQLLATTIANNFIEENLSQQREQIKALQLANDPDKVQVLLAEKLERERQYYEQQVEILRRQVSQILNQPDSAEKNELLGTTQQQLSGYEERLLQIMRDQISLQPESEKDLIKVPVIIEPAPLPTAPIRTQDVQEVLYALVASLILGVSLAFGLEYLDYTVKGPEDLELLVGQRALAVLTETKQLSKNNPHLFVLSHSRSPLAEAFRALRTNLQFNRVGQRLRSIVITSANPGEGKTMVSSNLSVVLANAGQKVIVVDADLRRPSVHKRFQLTNQRGLTTLLLDKNPTELSVMEQHLQAGPVDNLYVLTSGPIPPNPSELLSTEVAHQIFEALEGVADIVIYDTPPALTVTDGVILASRSDATLQVVLSGVTRRNLVTATREVLERVGAKVLPPVLNRVKKGDVGYYYYQYYYSNKYTSEEKNDENLHHSNNGHKQKVVL